MQKFRSISRPLNSSLEKNAWHIWSQLFKTVPNLRIKQKMAIWTTLLIRQFWNWREIFEIYNPIKVKCLQQAFHIDWVVYFKNFLPISKLPNQYMKTSQSMWNACSKHFTSVDDRNRKIPKQLKPKFWFGLPKRNLALFKYAICCLFSKNIMIKSILQIVVCLVA